MTDPAIIEAAARAICIGRGYNPDDHYGESQPNWTQYLHQASRTLTAVTPLIEAAALERAAQMVESDFYYASRREIIAAIRALIPGVLIPPTNKQTPLSLTDNPLAQLKK